MDTSVEEADCMEKNIKLGTDFIRFQYFPHMLLTLAFCLASVCFVGFRNLDAQQSATIMERYVVFIGAMLLAPQFMPEQEKEIWQLEQTRKTSMWQLYLIRLVLGVACILMIVTTFLLILKNSNSEVYFGKMWYGAVCETLFLGAIGYFVSAVTNQVIMGYMASAVYYMVNIGKDIFGKLALFQMARNKYGFAGYMFFVTVVLIVTGILIRERKR